MKLMLSAIVALAILNSTSLGAAEKLTTSTIDVYSTTPLPSIGLPLDLVPANIQVIKREDLKNQAGVSIADFAANNLQGVTVNETQGNPFQPDIHFRGYTASPLDGNPQGISVYLDGVRVNEPFGDTVRWDLIPSFAIQGMQLIPGSNPLYGLNTLGGAIALQTKSGRTNQGGAVELSGGSWGRKNISAEYGGVSKDGKVDYYLGANYFDEDGWRKHSPTTVKQTFAKVGWQDNATKIDLSYLNANNDMIGNGLAPLEILSSEGRDAIYTRPDQTRNFLNQLTLNLSHWVNDDVMLSANTYFRRSNRNTLNGDINDGYDHLQDCNEHDDYQGCEGVFNRTKTRQNSYGLQAQLAFNQDLLGKKNQLILGSGYDRSIVNFSQTAQFFDAFDSSRMPSGLDADGANPLNATALLKGKTQTWHLLVTDTISLNQIVHLTGSARYNHTKVDNIDHLSSVGTILGDAHGNAGGIHKFNRINPSVGLTIKPSENISFYGSYSESSRAPSAIELGCSDPAYPCLLPNAMASDPPLKQVVAKTYELGVRGNINEKVKWSASAYSAINHNDIQFIYSGTGSLGYFSNVGRTKRQGFDLALHGSLDKFSWGSSYGYVDATYDNDVELVNFAGDIDVSKGSRMTGIPQHQLKLRGQYQINPDWAVGANLVSFSGQYVVGNEHNAYVSENSNDRGKLPGYSIVNLDTQYQITKGWKFFAKAINVFDKDYYSVGRLGENAFASGSFISDGSPWHESAFVSPGAPRAGWVGFRYEFGGEGKKD